jgi:hypothetical protein
LSSDTTQTTQALRRELSDGRTGRLTTRESSGCVVDVYLMNGDVLAAHAEDDQEQLVRRLGVLGSLNSAESEALLSGDAELPIEDRLYEVVPEDPLLEVLFSRFKNNVARFLASDGPCVFSEMEAIFVTNLQFSHDTGALLAEAYEILDRTTGLLANPSPLVLVTRGSEPAILPTEDRLVRLVGLDGCTLDDLLRGSPFEAYESLDLLVDMIRRGTVNTAVNTAVELADSDIEEISVLSEVDIGVDTDIETDNDEPETICSEPVVGDPGHIVSPVEGMSYHSAPDDGVEDDELAMFADYDQERGALSEGQFTGDVRDRVDLTDVLVPEGNMLEKFEEAEDTPLEMGEADGSELDGPVASVQLNFTGPRMTNQEALRKLEVVNGVLGKLSAAFDAVSGSGSGLAQVQLLLNGSPAGFSLLYYQVEARRDGTINPNAILHNLRRRPVAEHRRLLNTGLRDLIERALSSACETLDDDVLDSLLESIAGYQQAIGL